MRKAILDCVAAAFLGGATFAVPAAAQQAPAPEQNRGDIPQHEPAKRNPNQKQGKRPKAKRPHNTAPKHVNPGDVPHRRPGKKSPDLKQPAPGTTPDSR